MLYRILAIVALGAAVGLADTYPREGGPASSARSGGSAAAVNCSTASAGHGLPPCPPGQDGAPTGMDDDVKCVQAFTDAAERCSEPSSRASGTACCAGIRAVGPTCLALNADVMRGLMLKHGFMKQALE